MLIKYCFFFKHLLRLNINIPLFVSVKLYCSASSEEGHVILSHLFLFFIVKVQQEFVNNMENTSIESLIQKLAESKGTGKERPGNTAISHTQH